MSFLFKFCFVLFNFFVLIHCDTLKTLFVLHRHGDRTAVSTFKNDPYYNDSYWPDGWGELTMAGKKRMYNVGLFLRKKYDGFLTDNIRESTVRSSDKDRCIESTMMVMNGIYKPKGRWNWEENATWQPFPVHTVPCRFDSMLYPSSYCPAAAAEKAKIAKSKYVQSLNEKYKNLYKYLTVNTGEQVNDVIKTSYFYDSLENELVANLKIPIWATPDVMKKMEECSIESIIIMGFTRKMQRLRAGVFLFDVATKIEQAINNAKPYSPDFNGLNSKKLNVYSSHDSFVTVVLSALQVKNNRPPPFGATLIFELHQHNQSAEDWKDGSSIKILYLNETEKNNPYPLTIPACADTDICTVKQFLSSIADLLIDPFKFNCHCKGECNENDILKTALKISSGSKVEKV